MDSLSVTFTEAEQRYFGELFTTLDVDSHGWVAFDRALNLINSSQLSGQQIQNLLELCGAARLGHFGRSQFYLALKLVAAAQSGYPFDSEQLTLKTNGLPLPLFYPGNIMATNCSVLTSNGCSNGSSSNKLPPPPPSAKPRTKRHSFNNGTNRSSYANHIYEQNPQLITTSNSVQQSTNSVSSYNNTRIEPGGPDSRVSRNHYRRRQQRHSSDEASSSEDEIAEDNKWQRFKEEQTEEEIKRHWRHFEEGDFIIGCVTVF